MPRVTVVQKARESKQERKCGKCGKGIHPGDKYYWWKNRTGPRGGVKQIRCAAHRPRMSEVVSNQYQSMILAPLENLTDGHPYESPDDYADAVEMVAETAREISEIMRENADNMESGFGHSIAPAEELRERADEWEWYSQAVDSAASEIRGLEEGDSWLDEADDYASMTEETPE